MEMDVSKQVIRRYSVPVQTVYDDNRMTGVLVSCELERTADGDKIVITTSESDGDE